MPSPNYGRASSRVREAVSEAHRLTGVSEDVLIRIFDRETGGTFNPSAANPNSSARGLGQFLDTTWAEMTERYGRKYGITKDTSRFDERASALMTAEYVLENQRTIRRLLGRDATPGEAYVAHFLGAGGAVEMARAVERSPDAAAADLFAREAAANRSVFFDRDGRKRSMREVYDSLTSTITGGTQARPTTAPIPGGALPNIYSGGALPSGENWWDSLRTGFVAAAEQEQTQVMAAQYAMRLGDPELAPDANFRWTPDLVSEVTKDLPEEYAKWVVENAHSRSHADDLVDRVRQDMENEAELAEYGVAGNLGLRGAAILTDVPTWLMGFGAGKIAGLYRLGRLATAGRAGLIAAAENAPAELIKTGTRPEYGVDDVILGTTTAFAFGSSFGLAFGAPGRQLDERFAGESARAFREGAERDGYLVTERGRTHFETLEAMGREPATDPAPIPGLRQQPRTAQSASAAATPDDAFGPTRATSWVDRLRIDVMGRLKSRPIPEVRELADKLDLDAVGDGGLTVRGGETAFENMRRNLSRLETTTFRAVEAAWDRYATRQGISGPNRVLLRREFEEAAFRELYAPSGRVDEVVEAADAYRDGYRAWLQEAKAAGAEWAAKVPEDELYAPMVFDRERIRAMVSRFNEDGVISVIRQALTAANPGLESSLAEKAAEGYFRTINNAVEGLEAVGTHALAGQDREALRELLSANGLSPAEADAVVEALRPAARSGGAPGHFRERTVLDDTGSFIPEGGTAADAFSARDLTKQDGREVFTEYSRSVAGHLAMIRAGFKSRAAFEKHAMEITRGLQNSRPGYDDQAAKSDLADLLYLGRSVYGVPHRDMTTTAAKIEAALGSYNFATVMGQAGVAQLGDMPKILLRTSVSAAWRTFRMSDLARVLRRGGPEADELARDLEVMTGVWTIHARRHVVSRFRDVDEFYPAALSHTALDRAVVATRTAANVTGVVSGMVPVTDFLGRWAVRASLQHLVDLARGVKAMPPAKVLNDMGLGVEELARFRGLIAKMRLAPNGVVESMNLRALQRADAEGLDKLGAWLSRQARLSVLEPTPGMLPRFMGESSWRLLFQFRSFSMASHAANTLHNLKMGWSYAAQSLLVGGAWTAAIYAAHTYAKSVGRGDREEYLQRTLNPTAWTAAAWTRSADAGLMPMLVDTVLTPVYAATGTESPFANARTTGLAANISGVPTVATITNAERTVSAFFGSAALEDRVWTEADQRRLQKLIPLNNTYGIANGLAALADQFPDEQDDR